MKTTLAIGVRLPDRLSGGGERIGLVTDDSQVELSPSPNCPGPFEGGKTGQHRTYSHHGRAAVRPL